MAEEPAWPLILRSLLNKGTLLRFWFPPCRLHSNRALPGVFTMTLPTAEPFKGSGCESPGDLVTKQILTQQVLGGTLESVFLTSSYLIH